MAAIAVGEHFEDLRPRAPARTRAIAARRLHRAHVHAVDLLAGNAEHRAAMIELLGERAAALDMRAHGVVVVLDHVDHRQLPQRGHVEALIDLALIGGALAEKGEADAVVAAIFVGEGEPVPSGAGAPTMPWPP